MSPVPTPNFVELSGGDLMQLAFYGLVAIYAIFTATLYYHWQSYSSDARIEFLTLVIYFAITIPLLLTLSAVAIVT